MNDGQLIVDSQFSGGNDSLPPDPAPAPAAPADQGFQGAPAQSDEDRWEVPDAGDGFDGVVVDTGLEPFDVGGAPPATDPAQTPPAPGHQGNQSLEAQVERFGQTGRIEDLPEVLQPAHRNMLSGFQGKMRELAEADARRSQEHQQMMHQLQMAMLAQQNPQEPAPSISDLDPHSETFGADLQRVMEHNAQQATAPLVQEIRRLQGTAEQAQMTAQEQQAVNVQTARVNALPEVPGYQRNDINAAMHEVASANAEWKTIAQTDVGLRQLQNEAVRILGQRSGAVQNAQHQAGAMSRSVTPPHPPGARQGPMETGPVASYGDSLADAARAAAKELGVNINL